MGAELHARMALPGLLLLGLAPASLTAQESPLSVTPRSPTPANIDCIGASAVWGGLGMVVGGLMGYQVERWIYDGNPDAGVTGLSLGMIGGAIVGIEIGQKACDERDEAELGRRLRRKVSTSPRVDRVAPSPEARVGWEPAGIRWPDPAIPFSAEVRLEPVRSPPGGR